jgi:protein TonB
MNTSLAWSPPVRVRTPLVIALSLALLLHLVLLAIHFSSPRPAPTHDSLPVVQIDLQASPPSPPPKQADMLAERDQHATQLSRAAAPLTSPQPQPTLAAAAPEPVTEPVIIPVPEQPPVHTPEKKTSKTPDKSSPTPATQSKPPSQPRPARPQTPPTPPATLTTETSLTERGLQMARLKSDYLQQSLRDDVTARSAVLTANTRYGPEAAYLNAWVNKVETIGNQNYPDEARRKNLNGRLMLEVQLDAWGKVLAIKVNRSSGYPILDTAAENIVRLGAPYAHFSLEMREKYDQITILRTWNFGSSGVNTH